MDHVRNYPHQPSVLITFHAFDEECKNQLTVTTPVIFQIKSTVSSDMVSWYFVVFRLASPGHTWEPRWLILIHTWASAQSQCHGYESHRRATLASEKKCNWFASGSDICSSAAKVILSAGPHVQWGKKKKLIFPAQIWKGNICWSGLERRARAREKRALQIWIRRGKMCLTF